MNIDRAVFALAGTMTLLSAALGAFVSPWWLLLAAFVGANQVQASRTGFCPAALILGRLGVPSGCAFSSSHPVKNPQGYRSPLQDRKQS